MEHSLGLTESSFKISLHQIPVVITGVGSDDPAGVYKIWGHFFLLGLSRLQSK